MKQLRLIFSVLWLVIIFCSAVQANKNSSPSIRLQYSHQDHVIGFGKSKIIIANNAHALTISLWQAKSVEPQADKPLKEQPGIDTPGSAPATVRYVHPWPGVTVIYRPDKNVIVKSDYVLEAGNIKQGLQQLRLHYSHPIALDNKGRLVIDYGIGQIIESPPVAWQETPSGKKEIQTVFVKYSDNIIGFQAADYDERYPLVIDPEITWSTFFGSTESDAGVAIANDNSGNIIVTGSSYATWGNPKRAYSGNSDTFVAKFDSNGNFLWNTFLGGTYEDRSYAIVTDLSNNIIVTGYSNTTWGNPKRSFSNCFDGYVAKLDSNGDLLWNTFLGSNDNDMAFAITVDRSGFIYVTGYSYDTWGSPKRAYIGGDSANAFVCVLGSSGDLHWNTFLGGTGGDSGNGIMVDSNDNILVTGNSGATWETPRRPFSGGRLDVFVAQLDSYCNFHWNTFLGGTETDYGKEIIIDTNDNIILTGYSDATWGSPTRDYSGDKDAFVTQLDSSGNLIWNTFLGSTATDYGRGIVTDNNGNIVVIGQSNASWGMPEIAYNGSEDVFLSQLDSTGNLVWSTFLGSTESDDGIGVTIDNNNILATGSSSATWGDPINPYTGISDAFIVKMPVYSPTPVPPVTANHIKPNYQVADKSITTTIIGKNFLSTPIIKLKKSGQTDITAGNIIIKSNFLLTCVFDLVNASHGVYDLFIDRAGTQDTYAKAFTVLALGPNPGKWQINDIGICGVSDTGTQSSITLADTDNDGQKDIYVTNRNNYFYQWHWHDDNWTHQDLPPFPSDKTNYHILGLDKDRDGIDEVYVASQNGHVYGYNEPGWGKTDLGAATGAVNALAIGDGNNDGEIELYAASEDSHVYEFKWNGASWDQTDLGAAAGPLKCVAVGDANNDNLFEVYAASSNHSVYQYSTTSGWPVTPTLIGSGNAGMTSVIVDAMEGSASQAVYASSEDGHIYQFKKTSSGWTPSDIANSTDEHAFYEIIASDAANAGSRRLYAACADGCIYQFEYSSSSWLPTIIGNCGTPLYTLAVGDATNQDQHALYSIGENNHIYQLKYIATEPTPTPTCTPTATITPIDGFSGKLLDEKFTYFAPNPTRGNHFKFVVHVPRECDIECKLFTTTNRFVLKFNLHCPGPGKYEHQEYVGNLANGAYLMLVTAKGMDETKERLVKKLALIK